MIAPIVEVTQQGSVWGDIWGDVLILGLLNLLLIGIVAYVAHQARTRPTMLPGVAG
jgi:hypothetical protein